jgi:hypothetical protein
MEPRAQNIKESGAAIFGVRRFGDRMISALLGLGALIAGGTAVLSAT